MSRTIRVKDDTLKRIQAWGGFGETMDDVVGRILDAADTQRRSSRGLDEVIREEAIRIAQEHGVSVGEVMAEAERLARAG